MSGPPCSGKSTLAAAVQDRLGGASLDVDRIRLELIPASEQSEADRNAAYAAMHADARRLLLGRVSPVILSATYIRFEQRRRLAATVAGLQLAALVVQCAVDPATAAARFEMRPAGHAAVDLTAAAVRAAAATYPFTPGEALVLETTTNVAASVERVAARLEAGATTSLTAWCRGAE